MIALRLPNCWSKFEREKTEASCTEEIFHWSNEWFLEPLCEVKWHWNNTLFSCATQHLEVEDLDCQWLNLAHYAITGKSLAVSATKRLSLLADQMQKELYQSCGVLEPHHQCAAIIEIRLYQDLTLYMSISTEYMPRKTIEEQGAVSGDIIDKMLGEQRVTLHSSLESLPMNLEQINSLKNGDRIMLKHRCDSEVTLLNKSYKTNVSGFLASVMGNRAIVVK
ncbi:hypothetical protein GCM10007978_01630 [Shewanella hanedai]|uniref:Flagellar motor switch protein FliN-like C-terminal domain-containing protein n=1 Tax=Shewanella hanedai TaxID=25 RepID=A0A553JUZ7_SHEHA|nr:hypothetical protein [Shewanella hanedai]TRY16275.1 hypothetical protein FN961_01205 [Shewanella hanedai]GGI67629.1 hypothetical protein GCM10007978_01630 [Shewanella hanedai]